MLKSLAAVMPESPYLFEPRDQTDVPDTLWLAEITREKVYKFVHQELPYHIYVATEKVETADDGVLDIHQKIVVATEGHKKIVVGKGGAQLKQIGMAARHEIQDEWGVNARLHIFVRVEPNWENKRENYEEQGLEFKKLKTFGRENIESKRTKMPEIIKKEKRTNKSNWTDAQWIGYLKIRKKNFPSLKNYA